MYYNNSKIKFEDQLIRIKNTSQNWEILSGMNMNDVISSNINTNMEILFISFKM